MEYIIVPDQWAIDNLGYGNPSYQFGYAIDNDGDYVTPVKAMTDFPDLFATLEDWEPVVKVLGVDDFPQPEPDL